MKSTFALSLLLLSASEAVNHTLPLSAKNVHWGYFSKTLEPALTVMSGDEVEVEMATHHGCDDWDLMIEGDPGMEDIFYWSHLDGANEHFRGATGGGDGVHILTGVSVFHELHNFAHITNPNTSTMHTILFVAYLCRGCPAG